MGSQAAVAFPAQCSGKQHWKECITTSSGSDGSLGRLAYIVVRNVMEKHLHDPERTALGFPGRGILVHVGFHQSSNRSSPPKP